MALGSNPASFKHKVSVYFVVFCLFGNSMTSTDEVMQYKIKYVWNANHFTTAYNVYEIYMKSNVSKRKTKWQLYRMISREDN